MVIGAWIALALVVVVLVYTTGAHRDETGRVTEGGRSNTGDLREGDCVRGLGEGTVRTVDLVTCEESHLAEVYATYGLEGEWSTAAQVQRLAEAGCADRFESFVGVPPESSQLSIFYLYPRDELSFHREPAVTCLVTTHADTTGTLQGSRR